MFGLYKQAQFIKKYQWVVSFITPSESIDLNSQFIKSISFPSIDIDLEDIDGASIKYYFAKSVKFTDVDITFYEIIDTYERVLKWQQSVYDFDRGIINVADNYMGQVILTQLQNNIKDGLYRITLHNAFPKSIKADTLDYTTDGVKLITMTFTYSHYTFEMLV